MKLNTDVERAEWLQCLQAAACQPYGGIEEHPKPSEVAREVAILADELYVQYRKRADQ